MGSTEVAFSWIGPLKYICRSKVVRLVTGWLFLCTCFLRLSIWVKNTNIKKGRIWSYLQLGLSERKVNRKNIVCYYLCKNSNPSLQLLIKRLKVELVKLKTTNKSKFRHTYTCIVEGSIVIFPLRFKRHKKWDQKRTFTLFDDDHALSSVRINALGGKCAAWTDSSVFRDSPLTKTVQVEIIEGLADVVKVKSGLAFGKHF